MNLQDLNTFAETARLGSLTKAAGALRMAQSNVTARIKLLETELGAPLLHRHHHGVSLTQKGQALLPYAHQMAVLAQKARESVSGAGEASGTLRIGSPQTTASARLPELLKAYAARYRKVDIAIETGTTQELVQRVLEHRLDGAFVVGSAEHPELEPVPAFVEDLVLVTPPGYRTARDYLTKGPVTKVFVFKVGCSYRYTLERHLAKLGVNLLNEMEFGTLEGIIGCVGAGLGMTLLPRSVVERSARRKEVAVHSLPRAESRAETLFIRRRDAPRSGSLDGLLKVLAGARRA